MAPVIEALDSGELTPLEFDWHNGYLPVLDALSAMQAAAVANHTFFEIGSGYSTIAARAAIQHKAPLQTSFPWILCQEPKPTNFAMTSSAIGRKIWI